MATTFEAEKHTALNAAAKPTTPASGRSQMAKRLFWERLQRYASKLATLHAHRYWQTKRQTDKYTDSRTDTIPRICSSRLATLPVCLMTWGSLSLVLPSIARPATAQKADGKIRISNKSIPNKELNKLWPCCSLLEESTRISSGNYFGGSKITTNVLQASSLEEVLNLSVHTVVNKTFLFILL